jgi:hypothetical protein
MYYWLLTGRNSISRANAFARGAVNTLIRVNYVNIPFFADAVNRTFRYTGAAVCAGVFINYVSHLFLLEYMRVYEI